MKRILEWLQSTRIPLNLFILVSLLVGVFVGCLVIRTLDSGTTSGRAKIVGLGVGVYWDVNSANPVTSLSWGNITVYQLNIETTKNLSIYVRNEGSEAITLHLNTSNWQPQAASKYLRLSWDYNGRELETMETISVTMFLSMDSRIVFEAPEIKDFSFDIIISAKDA